MLKVLTYLEVCAASCSLWKAGLGADAICFNDCIACCIEYSIILLGLLTDEFSTFRMINNTR